MCPKSDSDGDDRLSILPDAVLARILSSFNLKAAVQTSVLSKRWRTLWRETDVVNLNTREEYLDIHYDGPTFLPVPLPGREFLRDALAAVGANGRCPVRRVSIRAVPRDIMRTSTGMDALLAAPAMRRLEEFHMELTAESWQPREQYVLPPGLLPSTSLRVLDIRGCKLGSQGGGAAVFGSLETLRIVHCVTPSEALQSMLDAAPNLSTLWLEHVIFPPGQEHPSVDWDTVMSLRRRLLLRCPNATVSVTLMHCHCLWTDGVDLDAPAARTLRYAGFLEDFPFSSAMPSGPRANLQHMELSFCTSRCTFMLTSRMGVAEPHAIFWQSIGRFSRLRFMQLELPDINDIAVQAEQEDAFLKVFPDLRFLKLKGSYQEDSRGAAVAIANLLQCCPLMQEFHFKCDLPQEFHFKCDFPSEPYTFPSQLDHEEPIESSKRIEWRTITTPSSGDDDDADLAALKARSFHCLDHHLRKIRFEFELENLDDCFEVKLTKFFVENAAVLEKMEVHDGDLRVFDHIHHRLAEWRAKSSKTEVKIVGKHGKRF